MHKDANVFDAFTRYCLFRYMFDTSNKQRGVRNLVKIAIYVDTSGSMNERFQGEMDPNSSGARTSMFRSFMRALGVKGKVKKSVIARAMWENLVPTFKDRQTKISTMVTSTMMVRWDTD